MKYLKLAGLCLVAMLMMGMVLAGTASAVGTYKTCQSGGTGTKYSEENCETASGSGTFSVAELTSTEKGVLNGTVGLADTKVPIAGTVEVSCTAKESRGVVGPGKHGKVTTIKGVECTNVKGCENTPTAEARNLPWRTELAEVENESKGKEAGTTLEAESGEAGWAVKCKVLGVEKADECTTNSGLVGFVSLLYTKGFFNNPAGNKRWLLALRFLETHLAKCSVGGTGAGRVRGTILLLAFRLNGHGEPEDRNLLLF
jgi:hypothetical protein